ncbi:hypothetical protein [Paraburkholderia sp. Ac-20347]|uniref:hypothetical protein n=1 Tax=Paraburkholderia sp. Ac-20347 TaxID=2703892 RepID=UPI00197FDA33|nr:hypothetical protein [Paraburkholderia sp. Ac-20347]MBN3810332.1 hypothetical protein [Paraburkholderia sp. Ac-20347]
MSADRAFFQRKWRLATAADRRPTIHQRLTKAGCDAESAIAALHKYAGSLARPRRNCHTGGPPTITGAFFLLFYTP